MTALTALTQELVELIGACEEVEVPILIGGDFTRFETGAKKRSPITADIMRWTSFA